ncbi:MAG: outer membrane protein assembly factor BamD [Oligoflexia bacterium]|nr:outer membrane protein assembly factor BamD [Oligoflexia bacterium]
MATNIKLKMKIISAGTALQFFIRVSILCITSILVSCSSTPPAGKTPAEVLFQQAEAHVKKERYLLATERLNTIKSQYPYSYYSTHAELLLADISFLQENYPEAAAAYLSFKELHPKHEKMNYVIWKIAESYNGQMPSTNDRDLSLGKEAIKYYNEMIDKYPQSEYVPAAKEKISRIAEMLQQQDIYIADYYYRTDTYDSARFRYLDILEKYQDKKVQDYAMLKVVKTSMLLDNYSDCIKYADSYSDRISEGYKTEVNGLRKECQKKEKKQEIKN